MRRATILAAALAVVVAACGGGGGEPLGAAEFCDRLQDVGDPVETGDLADLGRVVGEFEDLADAAPEAIRADMQVMADYLKAMAGGDVGDIDEGFERFLEASTNMESWAADNCNGVSSGEAGGGVAGGDDGETTTTVADDDGDGTGGDDDGGVLAGSAFCQQAAAIEDASNVEALGTGDFSGFAESAAAFEMLIGDAPAEIRDDMEVLGGFLRLVAEAYEGLDPNDPNAMLQVFEAIGPEIEAQGAALATAGANIERYLAEECGLDVGGDIVGDLGGGTGDEPFTYGDDPELDALWDACEDGDGKACDDLFFDSPFGSEYEEFGNTCGGRFEPYEVICEDEL